MKTNHKYSLCISVAAILILFSFNLLGQDPPDGPPDITPTPFQGGQPFPLGNVIIPPFNSADPGSTVLGDGQFLQLEVVSSLPNEASIQWKKDGQILEGKTGPTLMVSNVSELDDGTYQVELPLGQNILTSNEVEFEVVPLTQIEDVFESWSKRFFTFEELESHEISLDLADPDLDGISNLAEYFFGFNPRIQNQEPRVAIQSSDNTSLSFTYPRTHDRPDIFMSLQGSTSLNEWFSLSTNQMTVTPIEDGFEQVEMDVIWTLNPSYPRFLRLAFELAEP